MQPVTLSPCRRRLSHRRTYSANDLDVLSQYLAAAVRIGVATVSA